jgi:iron only hydrogenase large subunit-like protein
MEPVPLSTLQTLTSSTYHQEDASDSSAPFTPLPMFCSHCPGWICYAEKTHPQSLPYISTAKSAQQILGSIFKHILTKPSSLIDHAGVLLPHPPLLISSD